LHGVVDVVFEYHVCDACELQKMVARAESVARERLVRRKESLLRVAWREDNIKWGFVREAQRTFEEYAESLKDGSVGGI
jgi:hypothetical protein